MHLLHTLAVLAATDGIGTAAGVGGGGGILVTLSGLYIRDLVRGKSENSQEMREYWKMTIGEIVDKSIVDRIHPVLERQTTILGEMSKTMDRLTALEERRSRQEDIRALAKGAGGD